MPIVRQPYAILACAIATCVSLATTHPLQAQDTPVPDPAPAEQAAPAAPATAAPAFVGTWASDPAQCAVPQDQQNAPMVVSEAGFDQHEVHCTFKSVTPEGDTYKMSAECSVEGDAQAHNFSFAVAGDSLTVTDEEGATPMTRCP